MTKVLFIIPPKVQVLDINGPIQVFYEAIEYGANLTLHFGATSRSNEVESTPGLFFSNLSPYDAIALDSNDLVFIPGIDYQLLKDRIFLKSQQPFFDWLKKQSEKGAKICSVCTGAFLLAEAGILTGKQCTTHWKYFDDFQRRFPKIELQKNRLFVINQNIYSSAGVASGIDLSLFILEKLFGVRMASDVAKEVVIYLRRTTTDPQLSIFLKYRNHLDARIHDVQDFILDNLHRKVNIIEIADHVNTSPRNLTRSFKKATNITIGSFIDKLRIERANQLLNEGHKMDFIANQCGLKSTSQLRTLLKK